MIAAPNLRQTLDTVKSFVDEAANVSVVAALLMTVLMGFAALGVDLGKVFTDRRKAQGTVDLAALAAATDLANADKAAKATVGRNGYSGDTPVTVELGTYTADPAVAAANRFKTSSSSGANAARVTLQTTTKLLFGKLLTQSDRFAIRTSAVATQAAFAEFAIGSRLAKIDNGILNKILGGLLGTNLSLSAMDYQSLIDAKIDLFDFTNAIATNAQLTGPTYDSVLSGSVKIGTVLNALATTDKNAYGASSAAGKALSDVANAFAGVSDKMSLNSLVNFGPYGTMPLGQKPKVAVSASALDLLTAVAQIANGQHQVEAALAVNIPGIASATLKLAVGERPVNTSWVTVGMAGAQVHTAQTRILLTVQIGGSGSIASVSVPIYVELASATASLANVSCGFPIGSSTVTLAVTPSVIDAWIANVSNAQFTNFSSAPNPPAATLVNTSLVQVTGRAHVTMSNMSPQKVTFYYSDISQQTKKTVTTTDYTSSLTSKLLGDLQLNANVLGLGIGLPGAITSQVAGILAGATSPIDQLLASVLSALGVGIGQADVWVPGIRCDGAVLVN